MNFKINPQMIFWGFFICKNLGGKMNIKQLIDNAERIKNKKDIKRTRKTVLIQRFKKMGLEEPFVILEKPTTIQMLGIQERKSEAYGIAECMITPDLNDRELQKSFGVNNKEALLKKMFTEEELQDLSAIVGEMIVTKSQAQIVDDIKNL